MEKNKMTDLMFDTPGSGPCTREIVEGVPVPPETRSYRPIPNKEFLLMVEQVAQDCSLEVDTENANFGLAGKGQRMFGTYPLVGQNHFGDQVSLMLGVRNSYDKFLSAGVCFGSKVFVCSNLVFTGYASEDNSIVGRTSHRHTVNVLDGLHTRLVNALSKFEAYKVFQENFYGRLTETFLSEDEAYATIVRAVLADAIPNREIVHVANNWNFQEDEPIEENPNWHKEFQPRTAWSLFNCFTENAKEFQKKNPVNANARSIELTRFFNDTFNN